jgi:hypothetical protein
LSFFAVSFCYGSVFFAGPWPNSIWVHPSVEALVYGVRALSYAIPPDFLLARGFSSDPTGAKRCPASDWHGAGGTFGYEVGVALVVLLAMRLSLLLKPFDVHKIV